MVHQPSTSAAATTLMQPATLAKCQREAGGRSNVDGHGQKIAPVESCATDQFDLMRLPPEILLHFLGGLSVKQLWSLRSSCTHLRRAILSGAGARARRRKIHAKVEVMCVTGFGRLGPAADRYKDAFRVTLTDVDERRQKGDGSALHLSLDDMWEFWQDFCANWLAAFRVVRLTVDYEPMPSNPSKGYNSYQNAHHQMLNQRSLDLCRLVAHMIDLCAESGGLRAVELMRVEWPWCDRRRWDCVQKSLSRVSTLTMLRYQCDDVLPPCYTTMFGGGHLQRLETLSISARVRDYDSVHAPGTLQMELADGLALLPAENSLRRLQLHTNAFSQAIPAVGRKLADGVLAESPLRNVADLWLYTDVCLPRDTAFYQALASVFPSLRTLVIRLEECLNDGDLVRALQRLAGYDPAVRWGFPELQDVIVVSTKKLEDEGVLRLRDEAAQTLGVLRDSFAAVVKDLQLTNVSEHSATPSQEDNCAKVLCDKDFDLNIGHRGPSYPHDSIVCKDSITGSLTKSRFAGRLRFSLHTAAFYERHQSDGYAELAERRRPSAQRQADDTDDDSDDDNESDDGGRPSDDDDDDMMAVDVNAIEHEPLEQDEADDEME